LNLETLGANLKEWLPTYSNTSYLTEFRDTGVINSISITPDYENIKNDFIVWGQVGKGDNPLVVRYHLAIDNRPQLVTGTGLTPSLNSDGSWNYET